MINVLDENHEDENKQVNNTLIVFVGSVIFMVRDNENLTNDNIM